MIIWLFKRIILGVILTGIGLAAWNWYHPGDKNAAVAAIPLPTHEESQKPEAEPQNHQGCSEAEVAPPIHPPVPKMANDGWPENIRRLSQKDQRKKLYIYLPPHISMEEAKQW